MSRRPTGKAPRRPMSTTHLWRRHLRPLAHWLLVCTLALVAAVLVLPLVGCATSEVCGTLADGSEYCTIVKGKF